MPDQYKQSPSSESSSSMHTLTSAGCDALLRDPSSLMLHMWAAQGWGEMFTSPPCWSIRRDSSAMKQTASTYFDETLAGSFCDSNWYEGMAGAGGRSESRPHFTAAAPALLGFDIPIAQYWCVPQSQLPIALRRYLPVSTISFALRPQRGSTSHSRPGLLQSNCSCELQRAWAQASQSC